jgi:hypothetical protein
MERERSPSNSKFKNLKPKRNLKKLSGVLPEGRIWGPCLIFFPLAALAILDPVLHILGLFSASFQS